MSNWTEKDYDPSEHKMKKAWLEDDPTGNGGYPSNYFFADTLRSLIIGFGQYFNDLYVVHYDEFGNPVKKIQVPIKFGPRSKAFDFRKEQESGDKYYIPLPNITYRIDSVAFDGNRQTGANETRAFYSDYFEKNGVDYIMANKFWSDIQPVPQTINISMEAKTEFIADAYQLLEQINVRFNPDGWFNLKEFWFANIRRAIKMQLESSNIEINTDYGEEDKREITVSFTFKLDAWFYKPIKESYVIDQIITTLQNNDGQGEIYHNNIRGNYNGSLSSRYNFEHIFGTKIGYVSALKPMDEQPEIIVKDGNIYQEFKYNETKEITNYPEGSKLITSISSLFDPNGVIYKKYEDTFKLHENTNYCHFIDKNNKAMPASHNNVWKLQYWTCTGNSLTDLCPGGSAIYEVFHNPNYNNCSNIEHRKLEKSIEESKMTSAEYYELERQHKEQCCGGTIVKTYYNPSGWGNFKSDANYYFGTKSADFETNTVQNAPYIISSYKESVE